MTVSSWRVSIAPAVREWWMVLLALTLACIGLWGIFARPSDGDGREWRQQERIAALEDARAKADRERATLKDMSAEQSRLTRETFANVIALRQEVHRWQAESAKKGH